MTDADTDVTTDLALYSELRAACIAVFARHGIEVINVHLKP